MSDDISAYRYLFGPVPSRRLGRSLGIDLTPPKTCSYNCVYCQLGPTACPTVERREWVPTAEVLAELERWAAAGAQADIVTLAGSGEPTLHTRFGDVLAHAHRLTTLPTCLLTNGSLLDLEPVRAGARQASIVKVTLSAPNAATWRRIHRPAAQLGFERVLAGLRAFRREYAGRLWLEFMALDGINAAEADAQALADLARELEPERVQINTPVRPPAEDGIRPLGRERLESLARLFDPPAEIIGAYGGPALGNVGDADDAIVRLVSRHPAARVEVEGAFAMDCLEAQARLEALERAGRIRAIEREGITYFTAPDRSAIL